MKEEYLEVIDNLIIPNKDKGRYSEGGLPQLQNVTHFSPLTPCGVESCSAKHTLSLMGINIWWKLLSN